MDSSQMRAEKQANLASCISVTAAVAVVSTAKRLAGGDDQEQPPTAGSGEG